MKNNIYIKQIKAKIKIGGKYRVKRPRRKEQFIDNNYTVIAKDDRKFLAVMERTGIKESFLYQDIYCKYIDIEEL